MLKRPAWLVPASLVLLNLPPVAFGAIRLVGVALGRATLPEHDRLTTYPALLVVHIFAATSFAILGALQFLRRSRWHRMLGRMIAPLGIVAALSGMGLALLLPLGEGDVPLLRGLRLGSGYAMLGFIVLGLCAIRVRDVNAHGAWMTRAYAIGAASGTQFFTVAPYTLIAGGRSASITAFLMILGWAINLTIAELSLRRRTFAPRALAAIAFLVTCLAPGAAEAEEPADPRMKVLLDTAAESAHDKRIRDGAGSLACGVTFTGVGVASWITESRPNARTARDVVGGVFVGLGSLMMIGGTYALATRSELEKEREERVLLEQAEEARTERTATGIAAFVFAIAEITAGIAIEANADDRGLRWLGRGLMAGGVGAAIVGTSSFAIRSEEERLADLWRRDRSVPTPGSSLKLVPQLGLGQIGLAGTF